MIIGTNHFVSTSAAFRYYREQEIHRYAVRQKLADGSIKIGSAGITLEPGDKLIVIDDGARYAIETGKP